MSSAMVSNSTTWSANIVVDGVELEATPASHDLLKDTVQQAARDIAELGTEGHVIVFKTTKARGKQRDRSFFVYSEGGRVFAQAMGA